MLLAPRLPTHVKMYIPRSLCFHVFYLSMCKILFQEVSMSYHAQGEINTFPHGSFVWTVGQIPRINVTFLQSIFDVRKLLLWEFCPRFLFSSPGMCYSSLNYSLNYSIRPTQGEMIKNIIPTWEFHMGNADKIPKIVTFLGMMIVVCNL